MNHLPLFVSVFVLVWFQSHFVPTLTLQLNHNHPLDDGAYLRELSLPSDLAVRAYYNNTYLYPNNSIAVPLPSVPSKNVVNTISGTFTGGSVQVSGYNVRIPDDIQPAIAKAKAEKKPLEITAAHLEAVGSVRFTDVISVKIMAHTCSFENARIYTQPSRPSYSSTVITDVTPRTPPSMPGSGSVLVYCENIVSKTTRSNLYLYTYGNSGISGGSGGRGSNGKTGTHGRRGSCKAKKIFGIRVDCDKTTGQAGIPSTSGKDGARGGRGGNGGWGRYAKLYYGSIVGSERFRFYGYARGGRGGRGGSGGRPGTNGAYIPSIDYIIRCSSCKDRTRNENRPALKTPRSGETGSGGSKGIDGDVLLVQVPAKTPSITTQLDIQHLGELVALLERYYNDIVLADKSCEEAIAVINTIIQASSVAKSFHTAYSRAHAQVKDTMFHEIANRAQISKQSLLLRKSIFGPAVLSRKAPTPIKEELESEMQYMHSIADHITAARSESNIVSVVTEAASISIPATNYNVLKQDLALQRDTFKRAVIDTEARIEHAFSEISYSVEEYILKKKDDAERARKQKIFKAITSVVNIGIGIASMDFGALKDAPGKIIGAIKGIKLTWKDLAKLKSTSKKIKDALKPIKNETDAIKKLIDTSLDLKSEVETVAGQLKEAATEGCSFDDIKKLMDAAPDRADKFPNLVDYEMDFSTIREIGVVGDLSKALISIRAEKLTDQFSCVFGERLDEVPQVKTAFDSFFTLATTRVDILSRMVDVDIELRKLAVYEEGVNLQKEQLDGLRTAISSKRNFVITAATVTFEAARMKAIEIMERLSDSYGNIILKDLSNVFIKYAQKRLDNNGMYGQSASTQRSNLIRLEADLKKAFSVALSCATESAVPAKSYYSFDITRTDNPDIFANGVGTGPENTTALSLDINKDCAFYFGDKPPSPSLSNAGVIQSVCRPNAIKYNARIKSIAVEFIGGDESLLPAVKDSISATLEQTGRQTFHTKPGQYTSLEMAPLQFWLGYVPLRSGGSSTISYHPTCYLGDGGLRAVNLDSPRVCPSPFSSYTLQLGFGREPTVESYLSSVKAIRIHTFIVAYADRYTALRCFG